MRRLQFSCIFQGSPEWCLIQVVIYSSDTFKNSLINIIIWLHHQAPEIHMHAVQRTHSQSIERSPKEGHRKPQHWDTGWVWGGGGQKCKDFPCTPSLLMSSSHRSWLRFVSSLWFLLSLLLCTHQMLSPGGALRAHFPASLQEPTSGCTEAFQWGTKEEEAEAAFSSRRGRGPKLVVLKLEEEVEQIQRVCRKTQEKKIWRSADIDP